MTDASQKVTDTRGRVLEVRSIGIGDLFDLVEAAGDVSGNSAWMSLAMTVASVRSIDGVPVLTPTTKAAVKALGDKLGSDGIAATRSVLFPPATNDNAPDQTATTAKN